jgi:ABC-type uncharacterized transport system permease subunit
VSHFGQGAGFLTPEFDTAQLYLGGDVGTDTVHLLHGIPGLAATSEIIPGVYVSEVWLCLVGQLKHILRCSAVVSAWLCWRGMAYILPRK